MATTTPSGPPARASASPGSTTALRAANSRRILDVLRAAAAGLPVDGNGGPPAVPVTQADLARRTGLAPATVSSIVRELRSSGVVETEPGSGRRGTFVRLARSAGVVVGVDFGHTHLAVAVSDLNQAPLAELRIRLASDHPYDQGLDEATRLLEGALEQAHRRHDDVRAIGLGLPAPIADGVARSSAILPGWVGVDVGAAAEERWQCVVHVENDANLGALAEHRLGVSRDHDPSVFIKVSSGVGAGIVIDDRIFSGADGTAGEVGHLTLDDQGPVCRCGSRGCLEAYASTYAVQSMLAAQLPGATVAEIVAEARTGNVSARRALEDAGLHLGWGIAMIANLVNPGLVVVGGELARARDLLLEPARVGLRRHALDTVSATPIVAGRLGDRASLLGALVLAAESAQLAATG